MPVGKYPVLLSFIFRAKRRRGRGIPRQEGWTAKAVAQNSGKALVSRWAAHARLKMWWVKQMKGKMNVIGLEHTSACSDLVLQTNV